MRKIYLMILMLGAFTIATAQKLTFDDVAKTYVQSAGPIISGKEVSGYYYFLKMEKADRKNSVFRLVFADANLNTVATKDVTMLSTNYVSGASFDGKYISIKFLSLTTGGAFNAPKKDGAETIKVFDMKGNEVKTYDGVANAMAYYFHALMSGGTGNDEIENNDLVPLPSIGLIDIKPTY